MERRSSSKFQSSLILKLLMFVIGLSIGMTSSIYYKSFLSFLQTNISSSSTPFSPPILASPPPSPSPLLSPPPPPTPPALSPPPPPPLSPPLSPPPLPVSESLLVHKMDDDELFARAQALIPLAPRSVPKVAFLFLCRGHMPLAPLWEVFFKGHEDLYSIYVHPHPSHIDSIPSNSVFYKRRIPSKEVRWGETSVSDAERRLLASALLDPSNQKFVLQSESGIPLFNFTTIYRYLINSPKSFTDSFDHPAARARGRYHPNMFPTITVAQWRKGSQWFEVNRKIAVHVVSDTKYYPMFLQHCRPPCDVVDEHYIPTLINIIFPEENTNRSVTWVDWSRGGSHPRTFGRNDISEEFIDRMRFGANCIYNGNTTNLCFLFARKFSSGTLQPLLQLLPKLLFNDSAGVL